MWASTSEWAAAHRRGTRLTTGHSGGVSTIPPPVRGRVPVDAPEDADLVFINTCAVRDRPVTIPFSF